MDNQLVYRYANQPYADFWNLSKTEIIGRNIEDMVSEENVPLTATSAHQALQGTVVQLEQEVVVEGRPRFLHNKYQPDFDLEGNVAGFFLYCDEITRHQERSQNLLRIFDNVTAGLFWVDQNLVIKFAGQGGLKHFGFDAEDVVGKTIEELIGRDAYHVAEPHLKEGLQGKANQYENRICTGDGRSLEVQVHCVPDIALDGRVQGLFVVSFDITSIKSVQGELERAQQRLDMAVQASQLGIWETDPARGDWFFADHVEQLWGLKTGSLKNSIRKFDSRIHPLDYPKILEVRQLIEQEKTNHTVQFRALTNTGYRWMQAATHSQFDEQGNLMRRTGSITEIDQIKAAQIKSADEVEQRDLFLAMLSHELRNPMTAIYHAIYYAQETGDLPESLTEIFDIIDRQSKQMTELMDDLLEVSRFNQEKMYFTFTQIDLGQTLEELVTDFATQCEPENQRVVLQPINGPFWVSADQDPLNQAITKLLDHAKKYAAEKGLIEIIIGRKDEKVTCSVSDGSPGIPSQHQADVFEQFTRDDHDAYRSIAGLSIDLFLARCIIRELGGNISIENEGLGKGCAFTFWLPYSTPIDKTINVEKAES